MFNVVFNKVGGGFFKGGGATKADFFKATTRPREGLGSRPHHSGIDSAPGCWASLPSMEIDIPDRLDEVPEDLIQKVIDALPAYARLDEPGALLVVTRAGEDGDHVRVYPGTAQYQRADRN